ncbi:MAG: HDIG domain-containing protein, partial [Puniceicoccales bacterium]|nr:HDIG domain-containing protein [Puniceicoccales bacterium]
LAIFRAGLVPNVEVDDAATRQREEAAMDKIRDETVEVKEGAILVEKGKRITSAVIERWNAYRRQVTAPERSGYRSFQDLVENFVPSLGILLLVAVYSRVVMSPKPRKRRSITLMAVLVLVNLAMIRLALHFGESMPVQRLLMNSGIPSGADALIWMAPPALAAILVTLLAGPHMAILATFLVAGFSSIMLGHSMDVLFVAVIASLVGIWFSRGARNRGTVVRAGIFSGIAVAVTMFLLCISSGGLSVSELVWQVLGSMTGGLLTGAVAVAILPLLERVFKITPDIALLELTDYNHPLLRKLQLIAPGSFNHSVAVANLAEQIALVTDANSLLCRCAALFHDVGKMVKPEYFVENQRMGINPHSDINPTMSALVIKSHVREGIELAKEYKLPRVIIDIIEQHHGTGLIQYFYYKARQQSLHSASVSAAEKGTADETIFRYDGPRPRTKEAAIVLFADSMEAASRALKKVTPQSIGELVDAIIADRIRDGQLDSCPLTFSELQRIRGSLKSSLINMLHQRIVYPGATPEKEEERETDDTDEASSNK